MKTEQLKALWAKAFGDTEEVIAAFFSTAYDPQRCRCLQEAGEVTAALYWMDAEYAGNQFAYIYGVATDPGHRGKGLCRKLMEMTHRDLKAMGYAGAVLMPADAGLRKMYANMGYRECSAMTEFSCEAGKSVEVHTISREEYARLRRKYLPEGGLIQEKENLDYLETYAQLYAGEDFVLAAVHGENTLFGMELLGNPGAAQGILSPLGYETGTFRVPGDGMPFGMCIQLKENVPMPTYLGLAFD